MGKGRTLSVYRKEELAGYGFILPYAAFFCVFMLYGLYDGIRTSMVVQQFRRPERFCGLDHYISLFRDEHFIQAIVNTLGFVLIIVSLTFLLSVWISSTVFDKSIRFLSFIRVSYYIPTIASMVVMSIIWYCLLNTTSGMVPYYLKQCGFGTVNFLGDPNLAYGTVCLAVIFMNLGTAIVLYLAAMMGVSSEMLEAADIDGATRFQKIIHVLLPSVSGTTSYILVTNVVGVLKIFAVINLLTAGGPNYRTTSMMYFLYQSAFRYNNMGLASACGIIMFLFTVLISIPRMSRLVRDV